MKTCYKLICLGIEDVRYQKFPSGYELEAYVSFVLTRTDKKHHRFTHEGSVFINENKEVNLNINPWTDDEVDVEENTRKIQEDFKNNIVVINYIKNYLKDCLDDNLTDGLCDYKQRLLNIVEI